MTRGDWPGSSEDRAMLWRPRRGRTQRSSRSSGPAAQHPVLPSFPLNEFVGLFPAWCRTWPPREYLQDTRYTSQMDLRQLTVLQIFIGRNVCHHVVLRYEVVVLPILLISPGSSGSVRDGVSELVRVSSYQTVLNVTSPHAVSTWEDTVEYITRGHNLYQDQGEPLSTDVLNISVIQFLPRSTKVFRL